VDVEGRDENDAGALADHRLVRIGRVAANVVRRYLMRALAVVSLVAAVLGVSAAAVALAGSDAATSQRRALCGVERWTVKTLQDRPRLLPVKRATLAYLVSRSAPASLPKTRLPLERHVFRVTAAVTLVRSEEDGDLHLVLSDGQRTMIAESPSASCTRKATALRRRQMAQARTAVRVCAQATVTGVAFFDFKHGQTGVAPNAIELHPILGFACPASPPPPTTTTTTSATTTSPPPPPPPPPTTTSPPVANCAPSYPDVCIPPPPPDLDCKDIPYRNFRVIYNVPNPDPHGFDGDHDGIGCEA
jgi:hypothetical protein